MAETVDGNATFDHAVAPTTSALELGIGAGYAQGAGKLGGTMGNVEDVSGPGGLVEVNLGYRITPQLSLGAYGTFSKFQQGDHVVGNANVLGASAGVQATWHVRADRSIDPWVSLGTGWKALWINPVNSPSTSLQGLELARLQVGADYRVSRDVAIAPVIGASLSMFVGQENEMASSLTEIQDKQVNVTGFAGLAGRFGLVGSR
ncbi:MAG: hypothetical protein ABIY55_19490 [Kofleriaceae bacterium]